MHRWWETRVVQPLWKLRGGSPRTKERTLTGSVSPTPDCASEETNHSQRGISTPPSLRRPLQQQGLETAECPSTGAWISKRGRIHSGIVFLRGREGKLSFVTTWLGLEPVMKSECGQRKTNTVRYYVEVKF